MSKIVKTVSEYYQQNLFGEDQKAQEFLTERGITKRSALKTFGVGYANAKLNQAISQDQFDELREAGLMNHRNQCKFKSALTFTLTDEDGQPTDILALQFQNKSFKTIERTSNGVGNFKILKNTDEVYATDSPMTALRFYQEGILNIILTPDPESMKRVKVRKVTFVSHGYIEKKASLFEAEEISCAKMVQWNKDPHEVLKEVKVIKSNIPQSGILDKVVNDLDALGYVGEELNKKLAYLVSVSRKLERPLSAIIVSSSGAGKTGLMKAIAGLAPDEDKLMLSRITPQALYHMPKDALIEKLIVVDERNGSSMADYSIRTMQTSNVLTLAKPNSKDNKDGVKSIAVKSAYFESTTSDNINSENASRCFILHLDESPQATKTILEAQRRSKLGTTTEAYQSIRGWHHDFQRGLQSLPVVIPFVEKLTFPTHKVVYRREQEKFLSLIESSALLNQANRHIIDDIIYADVEDYKIAYELYVRVFGDIEREVSRNGTLFLKLLEENSIVTFCMRDALTISKWPYSSLYRVIQELLKYEYLKRDHSQKGQKQTFTRLDYTIYEDQVNRLIPPQQLSNTSSELLQGFSKAKKESDFSDNVSSDKNDGSALQNKESVS